MAVEISIQTRRDTATPKLEQFKEAMAGRAVKRAVGSACARLTQDHLNGLGPNKQGWPSTGFYAGAARGTSWDFTTDGIKISVDNDLAPGAMRQRYHGGTISSKGKLLTIPARAEFYGHRATEFDNLRFVPFASGAKALVVGKGGTGTVDFTTGLSRAVSGAGARAQSVVAYWLVESVDQDADPGVLPTNDEYVEEAKRAVLELVDRLKRGGRVE